MAEKPRPIPAHTLTPLHAVKPKPMEKVTLVIPCYNAGATIVKAVESALAQTVPVRIIVIDDCSADNSFERLTALAAQHPQLTVRRQARNGGPGAARNTGLRMVETAWVAGLDADDFLLPGRMARLLEHAERSDADFIADDIIRIWPGQRPEEGFRVWRDETLGTVRIDLARFVRENTLRHVGFRRELGYLKPMMRTDFLLKHGLSFREDMRLSEDYDFYARSLAAGAKLDVIDPCGYIALNRAGSLSKEIPTKAMQKVLDSDLALLAGPGVSSEARSALREHLTQTQIDLAWMKLIDAVRARNLAAALKIFASPLAVSTSIIVRLGKHFLKIPLYPQGRDEGRDTAAKA